MGEGGLQLRLKLLHNTYINSRLLGTKIHIQLCITPIRAGEEVPSIFWVLFAFLLVVSGRVVCCCGRTFTPLIIWNEQIKTKLYVKAERSSQVEKNSQNKCSSEMDLVGLQEQEYTRSKLLIKEQFLGLVMKEKVK